MMRRRRHLPLVVTFLLVSFSFHARAEPQVFSLNEAITRALSTDPRIKELQQLVEAARAQLQEAEGSDDLFIKFNSFVGTSPIVYGGLFKREPCGNGQTCENRRDRFSIADGLSPWSYTTLQVVKPIYTFGKVEHFSEAAQSNIKVKEQDVRLQRGNTVLDVKKAYYGHLAARETRIFLEDTRARIESSISLVRRWLDEGEGSVTQSDLYALETASGIAASYVAQAKVLENVSINGLKILTGLNLSAEISLADEKIKPVELPPLSLDDLQQKALKDRPEMTQIEAGLKARRELVSANKAMNRPNFYVGFAGMLSASPLRDRVDNPYIADPFNDVGGTPIVGVQWDWTPGVTSAKAAKENAELNALVEKSSFARQGIPFQVFEAYSRAQSANDSVKALEQAARSARRWMISTYTDFEAGVTKADKIVTAFQGYVLAYTDYMKTVFDHNMQVAQLEFIIGAYQ